MNVIKLQLDVNHDGTMDLSFGGPDNTSPDRPFVFWVNNDHDEPASGSNPDRDLNNWGVPPPFPPDYTYGAIRCQRNLEDFARLWVCCLPKLPSTSGCTITLGMTALSGNPAINLYAQYDTNGSAAYLSDTNAATAQFTQYRLNGQVVFDSSKKLGTINSNQAYTLPVGTDGTPDYTNFLFEGAGIGFGQLMLTISQGSNVLAQTVAWLDLHDVKDFYERAVITNSVSGVVSNWTSAVETVQQASSSGLADDSNLIVLVHGINVPASGWLIEGDTVFKRLYWSGYHGKFAAVKWPCEFFNLWTLLSTDTSVFNRSEIEGYKASTALSTYLTQLRARFPGYRQHLLVHSQGNSVVSEAIRQSGLTFDTYILTQGALPDSAYDASSPTNSTLLNAESLYGTPQWQPMGYRGIYTNFTGRIVNFYNPSDPVLAYWVTDQAAAKPDGYLKNLLIPTPYCTFDGTNGWHYNLTLSSYLVTDPQESRAMISRSRTLPIGQSGPASAHGVMQSAVDLNARYGFGRSFPDDHSAQWAWPIQTTRPYFQQALTSCQIQPAP